jgi:hypothetical protein
MRAGRRMAPSPYHAMAPARRGFFHGCKAKVLNQPPFSIPKAGQGWGAKVREGLPQQS